jgi:hypothetical protein
LLVLYELLEKQAFEIENGFRRSWQVARLPAITNIETVMSAGNDKKLGEN